MTAHTSAGVRQLRTSAGVRTARFLSTIPPITPTDTVFQPVNIGAGGWVTGISLSPDGSNRQVRTDTYGGYRWDTDQWVSTLTDETMPADQLATELERGEGFHAVVAGDAGLTFMAYRSAVYRSTDEGATWVKVLTGPVTSPNDNYRWWNRRMFIDPNDPDTVLYGTSSAGLYYTLDGGDNWTQVASGTLPFGTTAKGIIGVAVSAAGVWYAAPHGQGLYRSTNQGTSWTKISSDAQFMVSRTLAVAANEDVFVTGVADATTVTEGLQNKVWRYRSGAWADITPGPNRIWHGIDEDPSTPGRMFCHAAGGYEAWSTNYGTTWTLVTAHTFDSDSDIPWLALCFNYGSAIGGSTYVTSGGLQFDPVVSGRVWLTQGIGVWYADFPAGTTIDWHSQSTGIEQLVPTEVICPPGMAPRLTAWDRPIWVVDEYGAAPQVSVAAIADTPTGTPATLNGTLLAGFPREITYTWSVTSAPPGSTAVGISTIDGLFTPDVAGSYTLRLTATNTAGSGHADVTFTATPAATRIYMPGTTGNRITTPDHASLHITGDLRVRMKVALPVWDLTTLKYLYSRAAYRGGLGGTGLNLGLRFIANANSSGSITVNSPSGSLLGFVNGSAHWLEWFFDLSASQIIFRVSDDGTTWTTIGTVSTGATLSGGIYPATSQLALCWDLASNYLEATVYKFQVFNETDTMVAEFNAETVTKIGTRNPTTVTDAYGKVWTVAGTGWDWI